MLDANVGTFLSGKAEVGRVSDVVNFVVQHAEFHANLVVISEIVDQVIEIVLITEVSGPHSVIAFCAGKLVPLRQELLRSRSLCVHEDAGIEVIGMVIVEEYRWFGAKVNVGTPRNGKVCGLEAIKQWQEVAGDFGIGIEEKRLLVWGLNEVSGFQFKRMGIWRNSNYRIKWRLRAG